MNSRERVLAAINHQQPDRVPIDFGATGQTGISVCAEYRLREYLGLPQHDLDVFEIIQMLGVVDEDLRRMMKSDVIGMNHPGGQHGCVSERQEKAVHHARTARRHSSTKAMSSTFCRTAPSAVSAGRQNSTSVCIYAGGRILL